MSERAAARLAAWARMRRADAHRMMVTTRDSRAEMAYREDYGRFGEVIELASELARVTDALREADRAIERADAKLPEGAMCGVTHSILHDARYAIARALSGSGDAT